MALQKFYVKINWKNRPSTSTPLGAQNLNHVDTGVDELDNRIVTLDATKFNVSDAQNLCNGIEYDTGAGVFVFHYVNGATKRVDLNIEKIPVSMSLSPDGILTITNADGSKYTANIASLIVTINFVDSSEIDFQITDLGNVRTVTAIIKNGSITSAKLDPSIQADILNNRILAQTAAADSQTYSNDSRRYAVGGVIPADVQDNAKYYSEKAGLHAASANLSEGKAKTSETNSKESETAAKLSEANAFSSAQASESSKVVSAKSEENAKISENISKTNADKATEAATESGKFSESAESSKNAANTYATNAEKSATSSQEYALESRDWAEKAEEVVDIHIATPDRAGIIKPDNVTMKITEDGTASVPVATASVPGLMKPDGVTTQLGTGGSVSAKLATSSSSGISRPDNSTISISGSGVLLVKVVVDGDDIVE